MTAAYYLAAKYLPQSKITIYEGSDRVGGWIRSESKEVDVNGHKQTVMFERGPRAMSPGDMIHDQQDRLVLYDLVRLRTHLNIFERVKRFVELTRDLLVV